MQIYANLCNYAACTLVARSAGCHAGVSSAIKRMAVGPQLTTATPGEFPGALKGRRRTEIGELDRERRQRGVDERAAAVHEDELDERRPLARERREALNVIACVSRELGAVRTPRRTTECDALDASLELGPLHGAQEHARHRALRHAHAADVRVRLLEALTPQTALDLAKFA